MFYWKCFSTRRNHVEQNGKNQHITMSESFISKNCCLGLGFCKSSHFLYYKVYLSAAAFFISCLCLIVLFYFQLFEFLNNRSTEPGFYIVRENWNTKCKGVTTFWFNGGESNGFIRRVHRFIHNMERDLLCNGYRNFHLFIFWNELSTIRHKVSG